MRIQRFYNDLTPNINPTSYSNRLCLIVGILQDQNMPREHFFTMIWSQYWGKTILNMFITSIEGNLTLSSIIKSYAASLHWCFTWLMTWLKSCHPIDISFLFPPSYQCIGYFWSPIRKHNHSLCVSRSVTHFWFTTWLFPSRMSQKF